MTAAAGGGSSQAAAQAPQLRGAPEAKDANTVLRETLDMVRAHAEKGGLKLPPPPEEEQPKQGDSGPTLSKNQQEALMVFQSLCKVSMKEMQTGHNDSRIVRAKRTSLELLRNMLQKCGPVFSRCEELPAILKDPLFISLIKNSVSQTPEICVSSLQIFVLLIKSFTDPLKAEIGIFIDQILLRMLESGNSTYHHKYRALQVIYKLCNDASTALELFLNFDCDVEEKDLFFRIIDCLAKIAQGKYTTNEHLSLIRPHEERELRMLALRSLVALMNSLVEWAQRMKDGKKTNLSDGQESQRSSEPAVEEKDDVDSEEDDERSEAPSSIIMSTASNDTQISAVEAQKMRKRALQIGVCKFNLKPKRGLEYLRQSGFLSDEPAATAELFKNGDIGLCKTAVGDFLGEDKSFNKNVMTALVDSLEFKGKKLDVALRTFLAFFRLPGEAQKIDRMMEKFAEKYCQDNPDQFQNPDCAFVLSFSLIMLQTDLHNPGIKNKMTKDQFVSNNRGIDNGNNLPREYLESLYDAVSEKPISLKEDEEAIFLAESQAAHGIAEKFELFVRETESIVNKSEELMKQRNSPQRTAKYVYALNAEHAKPFFEMVCWPVLATLSILLEMHDEQASVELCMAGFKHGIRLAACFNMDTERDALVSSLATFTYLTTLKEIKQKNIECIKALLAIALADGVRNNLGTSWRYILLCIQQLERLKLIQTKAPQDFQFFTGGDDEGWTVATGNRGNSTPNSEKVMRRRPYGTATGVSALISFNSDDRQVELVNSEQVMAQIDTAQIDLLFNRSAQLKSNAIVDFVTQLARVSQDELLPSDQPSIFALQKLVEVAHYNMKRLPEIWSRIWQVLSQRIIQVAGHPNIHVGRYAIDSLRQLVSKFLDKDELGTSDVHAQLLGTFEVVMLRTPPPSAEVKELIVSSIANIVQAQFTKIKSGWKSVFRIVQAAARETDNKAAVHKSAFDIVNKVVFGRDIDAGESPYNKEFTPIFQEHLGDGIDTLVALARGEAHKQSLRAIEYLLRTMEYLAAGKGADLCNYNSVEPQTGGASGSRLPSTHFFVILRGLSDLVSDRREDVRSTALNSVFYSLRDHGGAAFNEDTWRTVFQEVVKPLFEVILAQLHQGDHALAPIITKVVLKGLREMRTEHFADYLPELFPMLCRLVSVEPKEIRLAVQDILLNQVTPLVANGKALSAPVAVTEESCGDTGGARDS